MSYGAGSLGANSLGSTTQTSPDRIGTGGQVTVLIEGERIEAYTDIEVKKRLNEVDTFSFEAFIEDNEDRALIQEGNEVKIIENYSDLLFKGRLTEVEYKSSFRAKCEGDGMEVKLLNRKTERETFSNTAANQIVNDIIDFNNTITKGSIDSAPNISLRFDHDNKARAVAGAANAVGFDWYVDQDPADDFETDRLNFVADAGGTAKETVEETVVEYDSTKTVSVTSSDTSDSYEESMENSPPKKAVYTFTPTEFADGSDDKTRYRMKNKPSENLIQELVVPHDDQTIRLSNAEDRVDATSSSGRVNTQLALTTGQEVTVELDFNYDNDTYDAEITTGGNTYNYSNLTLTTEDSNNDRSYDAESLNTALFTVLVFSSQAAAAETSFLEVTADTQQTLRLTIGQNARMVERNKDENFVANDITLLGRGDGINQLESRVFAASTQYTDTTQAIDENETGSFTVDDTSQLGSDGDSLTVRVGQEPMNVTISDSTTLSIDSRSVNNFNGDSTESIQHYNNIRVWLVENKTQNIGPFTPENKSSAQKGSSIEIKGVQQLRDTDKTIIDVSTLEKTADLELKNRFEDVFRLRVEATDPRITKNLDLGDNLIVQDLTAMNVDDEFQTVGFDIERASSNEGTELHLANRPRRLTERLSDIESDRDTLNAHMQGATNLAPINFNDNADNDHPLTSNLRVPSDAVAVNKVDVSFKRESFRGYVQNQAHSHEVNPVIDSETGERALQHTHDTSTGEYVNDVMVIPSENSQFDFSNEPDGLSVDIPSPPSGSFGGADVTVTWLNESGVGQDYSFELRDGNNNVLESESKVNVEDGNSIAFNYPLTSNDVSIGETIQAYFTEGEIETESSPSTSSYVKITATSSSSKSSDSSIGSSKTSSNAGTPSYGIFEPLNEPDIDVDLVVDGNTVQTFYDVSVGDEIGPVDVQVQLDDPVAGEYHEIKLVPKPLQSNIDDGTDKNGRCRLNTDVNGKIFIESTL